MKKLIILFLSFLLCVLPCYLQAQSCGQVDCQGLCGRFTDNNQDGFCDFSQLSNHIKDSLAKKNNQTETPQSKEIAPIQKNDSIIDTLKKSTIDEKISSPANHQNMKEEAAAFAFNLSFPMLCVCFIAYVLLYAITFMLSQCDVRKKNTHRKVWNIVFVVTLLILSIIGLSSLIIDKHHTIANYNDLIIYYIDFSIGVLLLTIFHLFAYRSHLKNIFCKKVN